MLVVIFLVLAALLRALLIPVILIVTVVLSFAATLGVSGFFFTHVFGFAGGADQSFPLFAFVFLVALGIDYNIFLMTRVREETGEFGTPCRCTARSCGDGRRDHVSRNRLGRNVCRTGNPATGLPRRDRICRAFGVLLDTIIVRSVLVPALSHDIGKRIWWPSELARAKD